MEKRKKRKCMYERGGDDGVRFESGSNILTKGDWKGGRSETNGNKRKRKGSNNWMKTQPRIDSEKYGKLIKNEHC